MASKVDKNGGESSGSSGHDVTAEWIVRAQLKIKQPKKQKASSFSSGDCGASRSSGSPCHFVYKWTSDANNQEPQKMEGVKDSYNEKTSKIKIPSASQSLDCNQIDDHLTATCKVLRSTCNIVLSADVCPNALKKNEKENCVTHTITLLPDQNHLNEKKDASCQTSDCEVIYSRDLKEKSRSKSVERRRKYYSDHRRATDSLAMSSSTRTDDTMHLKPPNKQASPAPTNVSSQSIEPSKKPPRTVHIDVYCTGSEVETSSSSSSLNIEDVTTKDTTKVFEGDDMFLKHRKVLSSRELPRKLTKEKTSIKVLQPENDEDKLFDFSRMLIQSGNEREEVYESKQMLFKKYLGDQRQINKFNDLKAVLNLRRQISDDVISSNYPNSSRSTIRDFTSSSLASAIANSAGVDNDDWRELDLAIQNGNFIVNENSDDNSFEKIKEFKRLWNRSNEEPENDLLKQHKLMENFLFTNKQHLDDGYLGKFEYQKLNEIENISDSSPSTVISLSHKKSEKFEKISKELSPTQNLIPTKVYDQNSQSTDYSLVSPLKSGRNYSKDHYELATKFGTVIKSMRKPGHHNGPVRNPACLCETCKRWVLERDQNQPRERAYSFGETPITRTNFWRRNNRYYV